MTARDVKPTGKLPLTVLVEMRPALDGFAGIPQETRLLFKGLCLLPSVTVQGLLQSSLRFLPAGMLRPRGEAGDAVHEQSTSRQALPVPSEDERLGHYSRFVLTLDSKLSKKPLDMLNRYWHRREAIVKLTIKTLWIPCQRIPLTWFEPLRFETVVWQVLFAKTLAPQDLPLVTSRNFRVCTVPWNILQSVGLASLKFRAGRVASYPRLRTAGVDVFISQTPYPGRVDTDTTLVVRYHDALPVFMSPAFANKERHQATHFRALQANVESGAWFACVSEATRQDLLGLFPELGERAVTIHNMVSPHFFDEPSPGHRVRHIMRRRVNTEAPLARPGFQSLQEQAAFYARHLGVVDADEITAQDASHSDSVDAATPSKSSTEPLRYLLLVSTIEPRKNHAQLIAAWEAVRTEHDPALKLVLVGSVGWDVEPILGEMRNWIDRGQLFVLSGVPAADLRVLYRHAAATVCPSLAEGFDYSGVEAMCSSGLVIASNIPVHREIYADAAEYFEPYSSDSLVNTLKRVLYDTSAAQVQAKLRAHGKEVSLRYSPAVVLPRWENFLKHITGCKEAAVDLSPHFEKTK